MSETKSETPETAVDTAQNSAVGRPFKKGQGGNPAGRPKGARSKLSEAFLGKLLDDFNMHGEKAVEALRQSDPKAYLHIIAAIATKVPLAEVNVNNTIVDQSKVMVVVDHGSDEEWEAKLREQQRRLTDEAAMISTGEPSET